MRDVQSNRAALQALADGLRDLLTLEHPQHSFVVTVRQGDLANGHGRAPATVNRRGDARASGNDADAMVNRDRTTSTDLLDQDRLGEAA